MTPNPNPSPELQPCPLCGGEGDIESQPSYDQAAATNERHRVWCDQCGFGMDWHNYKPDAVAAWDTRAGSDDAHLRERIAVLERENRNYAKTMDMIGQLPAAPTISPQTLAAPGEVDFRALLIEAGRNAGAYLDDRVSDDFLKVIPEEVRLRIASLATVAAANDEGVALDAAISAMGWYDKRMIDDARKVAAGDRFETYGYGGECCLTGPQVASFRSCLDGALAAIRLLTQGGGK